MENNQTTPSLVELWGNTTFCKIYPVLNIEKIKFSFADKSKPTEGIDIWMDVDDFIADFMDIINSGELRKLLYAEKKRFTEAKEQYGKDIWKSRAGKTSDGDIRAFSIQPGMKTEVVFRATQGKRSVIVGFDYRELKLLSLRWAYLFKDYEEQFASKYTVKSMESSYYKGEDVSSNFANMQKKLASSNTQDNAPNVPKNNNTTSAGKNSVTISQTPAYSVSGKAEQHTAPQHITPTPIKIRLKTTSELKTIKDGCIGFCAITENNIDVRVFITKETISSIEPAVWNTFSNKCSSVGGFVTVFGVLKENKVYVKSVA